MPCETASVTPALAPAASAATINVTGSITTSPKPNPLGAGTQDHRRPAVAPPQPPRASAGRERARTTHVSPYKCHSPSGVRTDALTGAPGAPPQVARPTDWRSLRRGRRDVG